MYKSWTEGLDKTAASEMRQDFLASKPVRDRLAVLINAKIEKANKAQLLTGNYDCPNWAYKQADNVGYNRALEEILKLIENS